ncbi:MAG: hypothetical protein R2716_00865 [Microthrixaceae bacterium]
MADLALAGRSGVTALAWGGPATGSACSEGLARRSRIVDAVLMAAAGALGVFAYALVAALFGQPTLGDDNLFVIIAMVAAWNALLSPLVVPVRWAGQHPELRAAR